MSTLDPLARRAIAQLTGSVPPRLRVIERPLACASPPPGLAPPKRALALVTFDLDDPTPGWPDALRQRLRWFPIQPLAELQPELRALLEPRREKLTLAQVLASPRLAPAVAALLGALGPVEARRRSWRLIDAGGKPLLRLGGFTNGLREGLELRASPRGIARFPTLSVMAPHPQDGRWAVRLELPPSRAPALALQLQLKNLRPLPARAP